MFELKRKGVISTEIKIGDEVIPVIIDIEKSAKRLMKAQAQIEAAQRIKKATAENLMQLEAASLELMRVVFGEAADRILAFYGGNHAEMISDALPFMQSEIFPRFREYSKQQKKQLVKARRGW